MEKRNNGEKKLNKQVQGLFFSSLLFPITKELSINK